MIVDSIVYSIYSFADVSKDILNEVVKLSFLVMSGIIVMVFAFAKDLNIAKKGVISTLLMEYSFLIFCSTVIFRATFVDMAFELTPFGSYVAIDEGGHDDLIKKNLMNVVLGVPVALLMNFIMNRCSLWKAMLIGFLSH